MAHHVMVDIETLGLGPSAVVLSIGAVLFDQNGLIEAHPRMKFYHELEIQSQINVGRVVTESTLQFWSKQFDTFTSLINSEDKVPTIEAVSEFCQYIGNMGDDTCIWANSPEFDLAILNDLAQTFGYIIPWNFRNFRDYRTARKLIVPNEVRFTVPHHALMDATLQAQFLIQHMSDLL